MEHILDMSTVERMLLDEAAIRRTPMTGSIELLPLCNMNCDMCYVRLTPEEVEKQGRIRTVEEWLEIARQMKEAGVLFLLLTGGEPLLYSGFRELYQELKQMGMILTINTNGTMIDEEWAEFFGKHKPRRINITLYGGSKETYDHLCHYPAGFERVMRGIEFLKKHEVDVRIGCSATNENQKDIEQIIEIGKQMGMPTLIDTYMLPATRERTTEYKHQVRLSPEDAAKARIRTLKIELSEELFVQYRKQTLWEVDHILPETEPMHMSCQAGKTSFTINWQGEMRPCVILSQPSISVFEHGFQKAWEYMVQETEKFTLNLKCSACNLRPVCKNCAASAWIEAGSYDAVPDYLCRQSKEFVRQLRLEEAEYIEKE